ncbi:hypothetical protein [Dongshaea marina]|uniref:hypothetical protein n=1 Tax=Dongshaea marina TaxID=2047966 RepID=UPI000D3E215C|nr:hypothetical protein [Dongshaea marina]
MSSFHEHGYYSIDPIGQLLIIRIGGAWNQQTALKYEEEIRELLPELMGSPWAAVSDMRDWELCTPEVLENWQQMSFYLSKDYNLRYMGLIINSALEKYLTRKVTDNATRDLTVQYFDTPELAIDWCEQQLKIATRAPLPEEQQPGLSARK